MNGPSPKGFAACVEQPSLCASAARFGVSEKVAELVKWYMSLPDEVREQYGPYRHGLIIPFYDIHGAPSIDPKTGKPYERVRLWGWEGKGKYRAPFGSGIHAYLTPHPAINWAETARNTKHPLLKTEGEGKAVRANTCGGQWPRTIGLTGVDCLYNKMGGIAYELAPFNYKDRLCFLVFDAPMKKEVRDSLTRTALRLCQKGAVVKLLSIDETPTYQKAKPGSKMGLDDFINAGGSWEELKKTQVAFDPKREEDKEFNPLLTSIAMIAKDSGILYVHTDGELCGVIRKSASMAEYYANVTMKIVNGRGEEVRTKAFPPWLGNKMRAELGKVVTRPDLPPLSVTPDGNWNSWRGFATMPRRNKKLARKFYQFLALFFSSPSKTRPGFRIVTAEGRHHAREFLMWMAHLFQYPAERRTASFNFVGEEGVGKSVLLELPAFIIGKDGAKILDADALETQWTTWADGTIYACINEPANKSKAIANKLKAIRTNPTLTVNNKYGACYEIDNLMTLGLSSNEFYTTAISETARRDWVWAPEWRPKDTYHGRRWGEDICAEIGKLSSGEDDSFRAAVLWELLYNVNLDDYNPRADAGGSKAKSRAAASSLGDLESEKAAAWEEMKSMVETQGIVIFQPENWKTWMDSLSLEVVRKTPLQTFLLGKAQDMGWFGSGHGIKMRINGGNPRNVWYIAKKRFSEYDKEEKHAGLIYGPTIKSDEMEFDDDDGLI